MDHPSRYNKKNPSISYVKEDAVQVVVKAVSWSGVMTKAKECFKSKHAGLTLIELALVLVLIGLLGWLFLPPSFQMQEQERIKETRAKLDAIEAALVRFVMLNDRLPCPAPGTLPDDNPSAGSEDCSSLNTPVVPWRSLGLTAKDAVDAWGVRITYRPWMSGGTPFSFASRPVTGPSGWSTLLGSSNLGHRVCSSPTCPAGGPVLADPDPGKKTGAAYVLISHGPNRCGGYWPSGQYLDLPSQCQGAPGGQGEQQNRNNTPPASNSPPNGYVDAPFSDSADNNHFDDIVRWRTIMAVAVEARKVQ
jgi:type II secretory pathway pseudopilin PulG